MDAPKPIVINGMCSLTFPSRAARFSYQWQGGVFMSGCYTGMSDRASKRIVVIIVLNYYNYYIERDNPNRMKVMSALLYPGRQAAQP